MPMRRPNTAVADTERRAEEEIHVTEDRTAYDCTVPVVAGGVDRVRRPNNVDENCVRIGSLWHDRNNATKARGPRSSDGVERPTIHIEVAEAQKVVSEGLGLRTLHTEVDETARCNGIGNSWACPYM